MTTMRFKDCGNGRGRRTTPARHTTDEHGHARETEAVPTATFQVLFAFVVLSHGRRRLVHFNVTEHPTADWTARQLLEACALEEAPR